MTLPRASFALIVLLPLSACISFGAKPPPQLLTLDATAAIAPGTTQSTASAATITVLVPVVGQALAGTRVPVQAGDTAIQYLTDAQWVEPPSRLFARLLSDTITARTGRVVLSGAQSLADPGARLSGELRNFGVVAASSEVVVTYDAALMRADGKGVEKRRFEARAPVASITPVPVAAALKQAANQVAGEVADWVGK